MNIGNWSEPESPLVLIGLTFLYGLMLVFSFFAARYLRVILHRILDKKAHQLPANSIENSTALTSSELNSYLLSVVIEIGIVNALFTIIWYGLEPFLIRIDLQFLLQNSFTSLPFLLASMYTIQAGWEALITWRNSQSKREPAPIE